MGYLWLMLLAGVVVAVGRLIGGDQKHAKLFNKMVDAFRLGDGEEAERLLAELEPKLSGVRDRYKVASALFGARAYEPALRMTDKALELKAEHPKLLRLKARLHGKMLKGDGVERLERCLELNPKDVEVRLELSELFLQLRRCDEVAALLEPYVAKEPKALRPRSILGESYFHAGQLEKSAEHLEQALAIRDLRRRQAVPMYENNLQNGYDFRFAAQGQWEEERDKMLLEQIHTGEARSPYIIRSSSDGGSECEQGQEVEAGAAIKRA